MGPTGSGVIPIERDPFDGENCRGGRMLSLVIFFSPPPILTFLSAAYWISALAFPLCLIDGRSSAQVPRESTPLKRKKIERSACQETVEALVASVGTLRRETTFFSSPSSALARRREIECGAGRSRNSLAGSLQRLETVSSLCLTPLERWHKFWRLLTLSGKWGGKFWTLCYFKFKRN